MDQGRPVVLIIDSLASRRRALALMVARHVPYRDTREAWSLSDAPIWLHEVDVIVTDRKLPDGDGADWIVKLREAGNQIPALVLSGSFEPPAGWAPGRAWWIPKPAQREEFDAALCAAMGAASSPVEVGTGGDGR